MEDFAAAALPWVRAAVVVLFCTLALAAVARASRTGPAGSWAAAMFGSLAAALGLSLVSEMLDIGMPAWVSRLGLVLLFAFPYLLLRFTASFRDLPRWLEAAAATWGAGLAVATLMIPANNADGWRWATAYLLAALFYWVLLSLATIVRLWRAGHGQPTVARRRMRLMSLATAALAIALLILVTGQLADEWPLLRTVVQLIALASAIAFGLGFSPPRAICLSWRQPEQQHLQSGMLAVLRATTPQDVARELLPPTTRIVGGAGAVLVDADGRVAAAYGDAPEVGTQIGTDLGRPGAVHSGPAPEVVPLGPGRGELVLWTSRYTPFFGRSDGDLLRSMGAIASLALERCQLLEHERARRAAVEQAQQEAERARREASQANTAKSVFLSRMSHELRTPLNAILGFAQLLEISDLDADDQDGVKHILKAGRHMLALIDDVLDLSRIEAGMLTISLEPVHTGELIEDSLALIRPLADKRSIKLIVDTDGCDCYVMTDRQRCRQVLLNLLSNAVKYNRDAGEVRVSCKAMTDQTLRLAVRDSGPGIDAERRELLFEPFQRLGAETSNIEGTGLGLALTKQLVERLGGVIGVDTTPGHGATFWVHLPLTERPADSPDWDEQEVPSRQTRARTLLLVEEDNLANLRVVEAMLRRRPGIAVVPAMQGGLATELAAEHEPDLIVLDLHLPDLPGGQVLQRLRADARTRDIPVVVASADATPGRVRQLREEGAFDYITKPLDLRHFLKVVDAAMAHRDSMRQQGQEFTCPD